MKNTKRQNKDNDRNRRAAQLRFSLNQSTVYTYYDVNGF